MKKIFSKITSNRKTEFQIETSINLHQGKKIVVKRALNESAIKHMNNVYDYYEKNIACGLLCKSKKIADGVLEFNYINGDTLSEKLLEALQKNSIEQLYKIVEEYKSVIVTMLGSDQPYDELITTKVNDANVDLTFDNIIIYDEKYTIIDYEWILDDVDVAFIVFRAVFAIVIKYGSAIEKFMKTDDFYKMFLIDVEKIDDYMKKNLKFNEYVYGAKESYDNLLKKYEKNQVDINRNTQGIDTYAQIYVKKTNEYSEADSVKFYELNDSFKVRYQVEITDNVHEIRIDPLNRPCICSKLNIFGLHEKEKVIIDDFRHNAYDLMNGKYLFYVDDPQIIIDKTNLYNLESIIVEFSVCNNPNELVNEFNNYVLLKEKKEDETQKQLVIELENSKKLMKQIELEVENGKKLIKQINDLSDEVYKYKLIVETLEYDKAIFKDMCRNLQKRLNEVVAENKVMKIQKVE